MRWAGHIAHKEVFEMHTKFSWEILKRKDIRASRENIKWDQRSRVGWYRLNSFGSE
jgi:hypothetical protein